MSELPYLAHEWARLKEAERQATEVRRAIEDKLCRLIGIAENFEGTKTATPDGWAIKITGRLTRSVDSDLLQQLAAEHGLSDHLSSLCRWKPELNKREWDNASQNIRDALSPAINTKPGRPSFAITQTTTTEE